MLEIDDGDKDDSLDDDSSYLGDSSYNESQLIQTSINDNGSSIKNSTELMVQPKPTITFISN